MAAPAFDIRVGALQRKMLDGLSHCLALARGEQVSGAHNTCSALAALAVNNTYVAFALHPLPHVCHNLEQHLQCWWVMIRERVASGVAMEICGTVL